MAETYKPPSNVQTQAKKPIEWKNKYKDEVKGGTQVGWTRANQLAKGENLSFDTVKRMHSFFSRHKGNEKISPEHKDTPWKDAGHVAWLLWGGDAGKEWAEKIVNSAKKEEAFLSEFNHSTTLEFFNDRKKTYVIFNGETLSLGQFLTLAKSDDNAFKALAVVKHKMKKVGFKGNLIQFIKIYLGKNNHDYDVFIRNGLPGDKPFVQFDNKELEDPDWAMLGENTMNFLESNLNAEEWLEEWEDSEEEIDEASKDALKKHDKGYYADGTKKKAGRTKDGKIIKKRKVRATPKKKSTSSDKKHNAKLAKQRDKKRGNS